MKNGFLIGFSVFLIGCSQIQKPDKMLSKNEMSQIFVENALYSNNPVSRNITNMEGVSKFILDQHKITSKDFMDNYKYYLANKQIPEIIEKAESQLSAMDPGFKDYLKKKQVGNPVLSREKSTNYGE